MKIVVGLGNPGAEYANTPHSVGFEVAEAFAARMGASWEEKRSFKARIARGTLGGERILVVEPLTYMNLSGASVAEVLRYSNATPADLTVVQDDIDLPVGRLRVRVGGSCGGHNGVRDIIAKLGTMAFVRVKLGVGKERGNVIGHVLGKFGRDARAIMDQTVAAAAQAVEAVVLQGPQAAMNLYNGWSPS